MNIKKIWQTGWLKQQTFISYSSGNWGASDEDPGRCSVCEGCLLLSRWLSSLCLISCREEVGEERAVGRSTLLKSSKLIHKSSILIWLGFKIGILGEDTMLDFWLLWQMWQRRVLVHGRQEAARGRDQDQIHGQNHASSDLLPVARPCVVQFPPPFKIVLPAGD
jgi:hypothetical protein